MNDVDTTDMSREQVGALVDKYKQEIEKEMGLELKKPKAQYYSREYQQFKKEYLPGRITLYEKGCNFAAKLLNLKPDPKKAELLQRAIDTCHLDITPTGAASFAILLPLAIIVVGSLLSYVLLQSTFFVFFFIVGGMLVYMPLTKLPFFLADNWRLKASNQMVLCTFYIVTYMRHTSNLENAIDFAAEHLGPPLSLDLKKVLWNVETGEYSSVRESMDHYLELWRDHSGEFVEAMQLIESSLFEGSEARRLEVLDKSLDVILTGTYEKMLHYAHDLKSPITMLNMLGIILPILGLVILPLVVAFMESAEWYHIAALYNVILPIAVYYMGRIILSKRPTGYGDTDITEMNPELKKYRNVIIKIGDGELKINPLFISGFVLLIFLLIGFSPLIIHQLNPDFDVVLYGSGSDLKMGVLGSPDIQNTSIKYYLLDYKMSSTQDQTSPKYGKIVGPFGIGAAILSIFVIIGFGVSIGLYYRLRSRNVIEIRRKTKELEKEFSSALFQLGNRIGDGLPAELAFERVAASMKDSVSGKFFELVSINIRKLGMGLQQAIFSPKTGALLSFPSGIIESSMKVLIQSSRKGPLIAAQSLMNISRYIKEIHNVDERLKDLLGETITSMKSQIHFLTPAIAGIVIGITSMISTILSKLGGLLAQAQQGSGEGTATKFPLLFGDGIPTYYFVIVVGLYVIQIVYVLTILANGVENGEDKMNENYQLGQNLVKSTLLFCAISLVIMIIFNIIATTIISRTLAQ